MKHAVLIVDDNKDVFDSLALILGYYEYECRWAETGEQAVSAARSEKIDAVLLDLSLKGESGLDVLRMLMEVDASLPVIMITAFGSFETAVTAVKMGAVDFLPKPIKADKLVGALAGALANRELRAGAGAAPDAACPFATDDPATRGVLAKAAMLALTNIPILITGESGTGKELLTEYIHQSSPRRGRPLVQVNCSLFSETLVDNELFGHEKGAYTGAVQTHAGLFEQADGGTLHLDEVGDMSFALQAKLLRALESGAIRRLGGVRDIRVDVRIVASTNKDLDAMVVRGEFRSDILYRLSAAHLFLPPLRERENDLRLLADRYLREFSPGQAPKRFSAEAWERLAAHSWPGNVRELRGVVQTAAAVTAGEVIPVEALPRALSRGTSSMSGRLELAEKDIIEKTLEEARGNKSLAAERLGISRRTLYNKMARYGL